jgi:hypothetical protein
MKRFLLVALLFVAALPCSAQRVNTFYAREFVGATQGQKIQQAQAQCNASMTCVIVLDPDLALYAAGTIPAKCASCVWVDYRSTNPFSVSTSGGAVVELDPATGSGDLGAQIQSAIDALPATGGVIDARRFAGAQSAAATVNVNKPVTVYLGRVTFALSGCPGVNLSGQNAGLFGEGANATVLTTPSATCDVVQTNGAFWRVEQAGFRTTAVTRTAGAGLRVKSGNGYAEHLRFDKTYNGIQITDNGSGGHFRDVQMGSGLATGGNWNAGIIVGGVPSGTVTTMQFSAVGIATDAPFADAAIAIYDGADAITFDSVQVGQTGTSNPAIAFKVGRNTLGLYPEWIKVSNSHFEAPDNTDTVVLNEGRNIQFVNTYVAHGRNGVTVNAPCIACAWTGGEVFEVARSAFLLNGGMDVIGVKIGEVSTSGTGTYSSILVTAGVSDFHITGNTFASINGGSSSGKYNVEIAAGASNRFWVTQNEFGNYVTGPFLNGATGASQWFFANSPSPGAYFANGIQAESGFSIGAQSQTSINITRGAGAPAGACVTGSLYLRSDGAASTTLYVCQATAWAAK